MSQSNESKAVAVSASELRSNIFANAKKPERRTFTFNGVQLEYVQPPIGKVFDPNKAGSADNKAFIVQSMIEHSVVPGTNDQVFEASDYDAIMEMPMSGEMSAVVKIVQELMDISIDDKAKN